MNAKRLTLVFAAAVATLGWSAGLALGYCVYTPTNRANHDPGPIPVYLVAAGLIDIRGVGIGEDVISIRLLTITRYVEAAIDIINSSSAAAPPLYLAGYRSLNYNSPWSEFPPGITVSTYGNCNIQPTMGEFARHTFFENKSWIRMIRGGGSACDEFADPDYHWWVDPADDDGAAGTVLDFVGVLVHEFLHSLGLGHPDDSEMNLCEPGSYTETDAAQALAVSPNQLKAYTSLLAQPTFHTVNNLASSVESVGKLWFW